MASESFTDSEALFVKPASTRFRSLIIIEHIAMKKHEIRTNNVDKLFGLLRAVLCQPAGKLPIAV